VDKLLSGQFTLFGYSSIVFVVISGSGAALLPVASVLTRELWLNTSDRRKSFNAGTGFFVPSQLFFFEAKQTTVMHKMAK
jgi:hypothetical protein